MLPLENRSSCMLPQDRSGPAGRESMIERPCGREPDKGKTMMRRLGFPVALTSAVLLAGCAVPPPAGPTVMALPPQGKTFETFQQEDGYCRQTAAQTSGAGQTAAQAQNDAVGSAVVGTALGAAAGGLIGAAAGNVGAGAAIGAGTGLLVGSSAGANAAARGGYAAQGQYDTAYTQCMYAYGNTVQSAPAAAAYPAPYAAPYPYPYGYPYGYAPGVVIGGYYGRPYRRW